MRLLRSSGKSLFLIASLIATFGVSGGCSESTEPVGAPDDATQGSGDFEGTIDPGQETFVLQTIETPVPGSEPVRAELVGRNFRISGDVVALSVAIRNVDRRTFHSPVELVLHRFTPPEVKPLGATWSDCPDDSTILATTDCSHGFDYSFLLGDDEQLDPGETSGFRTLAFQDPGLTPFSFAALLRVALVADLPRIEGVFFRDGNENGHRDGDETTLGGGAVRILDPDGAQRSVQVGEDGRYRLPLEKSGLYKLTAIPPPTFAPLRFTTPNPLEVLIPPGPEGRPQSFLHADFGLVNADLPGLPPPVLLFDGPADSLPQDRYDLLRIGLEGRVLHLEVGFGGCNAEQPFQLFMVGGFQESQPVQAALLLAHDNLGQLCRAYFERQQAYDLEPIRRAYRLQYGQPGKLVLVFTDWAGREHRFELDV